MNLIYLRKDIIKGGLIYCVGDTIAAIVEYDFSWMRIIGILIIGGTIYAFEIPNYFRWIDKQLKEQEGLITSLKRALLAMLYFNPLWIARHMLFILLLKGNFQAIDWSLLRVALYSFLFNIPISLIANYIIQNKISFTYRFIASAIFSGLMAIYYALSYHWFV